MQFSESEKHFLLRRAYLDAVPHVQRVLGESVLEEFHEMAFSSLTNDQFESIVKISGTITNLYVRRMFELERFLMTKESLDQRYENEPPVVDSIDLKDIPLRIIQIGMYVCWRDTEVYKEDIDGNKLFDNDEEYERRKDWHDFLFGYANQEACQDSLIDIDDVATERQKAVEIIKNVMGILYRNRNK